MKLRTVTLRLITRSELLGMASNPCVDALADLITVIVTRVPRYTNIGSIPPHYYNSIKGKNTDVKSMCSTFQCINGLNFNFKARLNFFLYLSVNESPIRSFNE
jgi:hypothetical protein